MLPSVIPIGKKIIVGKYTHVYKREWKTKHLYNGFFTDNRPLQKDTYGEIIDTYVANNKIIVKIQSLDDANKIIHVVSSKLKN